jgi:hypothetical protein
MFPGETGDTPKPGTCGGVPGINGEHAGCPRFSRFSPGFRQWFVSLNPPARAKVVIALTRIEQGNFSNVKSVGSGVFEFRIDFGPDYRIYFGRDGGLWHEYRMRN